MGPARIDALPRENGVIEKMIGGGYYGSGKSFMIADTAEENIGSCTARRKEGNGKEGKGAISAVDKNNM